MENVLITGGAGFIGSHVCDLLIKNGYNVFVVDNLSSGQGKNLSKKISKFYNIDINSTEIEKVFKENKIDYVFHFAAQASVSFSTKNPTEDAIENILGSINMLKCAKKYGVKKFMVSSTAAVYGVPEYLPVDENHKTTCLSCYGVSKLTMEKYVQLMGIDYVIFRFANVYGPRQSAHGEAGVVAIFADKMKNNEDIRIDGDGEQTRDFVYVTDIAEACLRVIQSDVKNEIINVSTNTAISINKLFELMASKFEYTKAPEHAQERLGDIKHSILDNSKCKRLLNIVPKTPIDTGLDALVDYIKRSDFFLRKIRQIEVTTNVGCSNTCVYCPQDVLLCAYFKNNRARKSEMTLSDFKSALQNLPKDFLINFGGMSEAFENPQTVDMILYAAAQNRKIRVNTTLKGLSVEDIEKIKDVEFESWLVHTPDGDGFMRQEVTIDYLDRLKRVETLKIKNLSYEVIGKPHNLIENILGEKLKVSKIDSRGNNLKLGKMPKGVKLKCKNVPSTDTDVKVVCGKSLNLISALKHQASSPVLLPDGSILLCANDFGLKHVLGNLYKDNYKKIMHGKVMKSLKASQNCKMTNYLLCRECEWALDGEDSDWKINLFNKYVGNFPLFKIARKIKKTRLSKFVKR